MPLAQYVITDGSRWIMKDRKGKYVPTSCHSLADVWSKDAAEKVYNNSLAKGLKTIFYLDKIDTPAKGIKQLTKKEIDKNAPKLSDSESIKQLIDKASSLSKFVEDTRNRETELNSKLSEADRRISVIKHYIEFSNVNVVQGYKVETELKAALIERRKVKNELVVVRYITSRISNDIMPGLEDLIHRMDNRKYNPKELDELFDL